MAFKDELRSLRLQDGLSQAELAKHLKISRSTVSMYESGKREPDFETLEIIADFFNVNMDRLLPKKDVPAESLAPEVSALAANDYITVTFEKLYEEPSIQGVAYLQLAITNNWDKEVWVYLDKGSVNDEQLTAFLSGLPTYIMPGKISRNPFIISYSNLSIESVNEIQSIEFDIVVAERESLDEVSRISGLTIQP